VRPSTAWTFGLRKYDVHRHGEGIRLEKSFGWGPPMSVRNDHDHQFDYDPSHLVLYGAAAVVLLVFAWTFVG
jgi:hypothetical protein